MLDGATHPDREKHEPKDGDISICVYCLSVNQFQEDNGEVRLVAFTKEMHEEFKLNFPDQYELINNYRTAIAAAKSKIPFTK